MVEYVPGRVVRHADELEALGDKQTISDCVDALIKVLADLHAVDPEAVGLGDFGKPSGYLERQVRRWGSQWELVKREDDPFDADVRRLHSALAEAIPSQSRSSIVHGDYRIDNTMLDSDDATKVLAVLDWEMSTLGDPISDAALMCVYRHPLFNVIHAEFGVGFAAHAGGRRTRPPLFACRRTALAQLGLLHGAGILQGGDHRRRHRIPGADGWRRRGRHRRGGPGSRPTDGRGPQRAEALMAGKR